MDAPSNAVNSAVSRQRASPANDHSSVSSQAGQQPYPYPVQQQQAGWSPPHPQQQFYPSFYQNHHQQPFQLHGHPAQNQMHSQNPYYDPANAQFAQWAYQQMMYNAAQAHQMSHVPPPHPGQRIRSGSASTGEYYVSGQVPGFSPFPSGTPPPHPSQLPNGYSPGSDVGAHQAQYNGFHPYRRPQRQGSSHTDSGTSPVNEWRNSPMGSFQPPYARADAAGSSTSVNSSHSGSSRHRTNSTQGPAAPQAGAAKAPSSNGHGSRGGGSSSPSGSTTSNSQRPHQRTTSSSSNSSAATSRPSAASSSAASSTTHGVTLRKPSPLSQGNFTAVAEKRMSRDDSDLAAMLEPAPGVRSGGLKGRLRRALSLNAGSTLREVDEEDHGKGSSRRPPASGSSANSTVVQGDDESTSTATVQKKKSRSLFNSRLNRSTDNISLSSTMSSASMVIRKLGNLGKLGRRNSLAGITSLFKDKKEKEKEGTEESKKGKKKKDGKGSVAEPSVSHATAELDPGEWSQDMSGLSPAARLARQHTLKSNAEAAARAKAEQEAKAASQAQQGNADPHLPATWEKSTTTRQGDGVPGRVTTRVNEDGSKVVVEDDDTDSEDGHGEHAAYSQNLDGWEEDDDEWGDAQDEDVTIRQGIESTVLEEEDEEEEDEDMEPWAMNVRRSVERTRRPAKGILKSEYHRYHHAGYEHANSVRWVRIRPRYL